MYSKRVSEGTTRVAANREAPALVSEEKTRCLKAEG